MPATRGDIRDFLVEELRKDLVGPSMRDEELKDRPTIHYLTGALYPWDSPISPEEDDGAAETAPEDDIDPGTLMASAFNPSAIGVTFSVPRGETILVRMKAATYVRTEANGGGEETVAEQTNDGDRGTDRDGAVDTKGRSEEAAPEGEESGAGCGGEKEVEKPRRKPEFVWKRREHSLEPLSLRIESSADSRYRILEGLELYVRARDRGNYMVVTVSMINTNRWPRSEGLIPDELCFFQPEIRIVSNPPERPIFLSRYQHDVRAADPDRELNDLLYRHAREFAVGHGCAAAWETSDGEHATEIRTELVPDFEVLQLSPDWTKPLPVQRMKYLAESDDEKIISGLRALVDRYREWISEQESVVEEVPPRLRSVARANLMSCREAAERMEAGISLLASDRTAMEAFRMANRAMLIQRARGEWINMPLEERPETPQLTAAHKWRPFQLGFMLLCLPSLADSENQYRGIVDLLWFPTGGGKTEAYLGLTAFAIFLRRLRGRGEARSAGVTVLMRYTLRLLTLQQFQRAAALIMACESMRRSREDLGKEAISLGLWVGGGATPNRLKEARVAIERLLNGTPVFEGNPCQIRTCPWCGEELTPRDYHVGISLRIRCPNTECDFSDGLPLYLVDEDIYRIQPSLLIGTVDKFARLPWLAETAALFGRAEPPRLPPELIIQDELHLISGPLGTLVGLYETAIDVLCSEDDAPPKIIASTATIRRAGDQVGALFARELRLVGVHAPGKSMKTALLRIYALLLQAIYSHRSNDRLRDPYWTLVGYFNSLRELGGAVRLVEDDVRARIEVLAGRHDGKKREIDSPRELTSRTGSDEIPEILELMAQPMWEDNALDVLLATNMISVGVDVDRLGLMVVAGQPKMTAEYIQATSRIGRKYPGLVVTLYNWARPRDRSHYERFMSYHSALYSHVEAASVTPFSDRARDRGLHAVLVALVRHLDQEMRAEEAAIRFSPDAVITKRAIEIIRERVRRVDPAEAGETLRQLDDSIQRWHRMARIKQELKYGPDYRNRDRPHLLVPAETALISDAEGFPTLNSLREVEGESTIYILAEMGEDR